MSNETGKKALSSHDTFGFAPTSHTTGAYLHAGVNYRVVNNITGVEVVLAGAKLIDYVKEVAGPLWTAVYLRFSFFRA